MMIRVQAWGIWRLNRFFGNETYTRMVWTRAHVIPDVDSRVERQDDLGYRIRFDDYGNRLSPYGWEVDYHPTPLIHGGSDHISNLRPLHCRARNTASYRTA